MPGIRIDLLNRSKRTATEEAQRKGHHEIVRLLEQQSILTPVVIARQPDDCPLSQKLEPSKRSFKERLELAECKQVPDWALDPISLEVMNDPRTLISGHTYDRSTVLELIDGKAKFTDPLTCETLDSASALQRKPTGLSRA